MDQRLRRTYYNLCKPYEALDPDDPRYVDLDSLGTPEARVRGVSWVEKLAEQIELSDEPVCQLFTGLPGSGKSTELRRLARRLEAANGANLFPVLTRPRRSSISPTRSTSPTSLLPSCMVPNPRCSRQKGRHLSPTQSGGRIRPRGAGSLVNTEHGLDYQRAHRPACSHSPGAADRAIFFNSRRDGQRARRGQASSRVREPLGAVEACHPSLAAGRIRSAKGATQRSPADSRERSPSSLRATRRRSSPRCNAPRSCPHPSTPWWPE